MRDATRAAFPAFTERHEGRVRWMYLDTAGLVTAGVGFLLPTAASAMCLGWLLTDGRPATAAQVADEYRKVASLQGLRHDGGGAFAVVTGLRATETSIDAEFARRLAQAETAMLSAFLAWSSWPADAQFDALSRCWAMGTHWPATWPHFVAAVRRGDWRATLADDRATGRQVGAMRTERMNLSFCQRNDAQLVMLANAACVAEQGLDPSALYWPRRLDAEGVDVDV